MGSTAPLSLQPIGLCLLSVVMPAFNEADNIAAALEEVSRHVLAEVPEAEVIVVDDGSRDGTAEAVLHASAGDPRIRLVRQGNAGHGPALVRGLGEARGVYCLLLDSDRQIGLESFADTWHLRQPQAMVIGVRERRQDPRHRLVLSAALQGLLRVSCGVAVRDANVPYKLVPRSLLIEALAAMPARPRIPSILLTVHLCRRGVRIAQQVVPHRARSAGEGSLRLARLIRFCVVAAAELARFRLRA